MERSALAHWSVLLVGVAALMALRVVHLDADTPARIGTGSVGVFVDEGYKTLDARNLVETGRARWHPADGYSGWADPSPLGHGAFLLAFRALGPELASARVATLGWTVLLLLTWVLVAHRLPLPVAALGLALLGLQHTVFFFSRIALLELPLMAFLYGALLPLVDRDAPALRTTPWIVAVAVAAGVGLKPSALLYFVPVLGGVAVAAWVRARRPSRSQLALAAAALVVPLAWGLLHRGALDGKLAVPEPADLRLVVLNPLSFASGLLLAAALFGLAWTLRRDPLGFLAAPYRAALALSALTGPLLFTPFPYAPLRYHVPLLPAFALLALETWRYRPTTPDDDTAHGSRRWTDALALIATIWGLIYAGHTLDQQFLRRLPVALFDPVVRGESSIRLILFVAPVALVIGLVIWRQLGRLKARDAHRMILALLAVALAHDILRIGQFVAEPTYQVREITAAIDARLPAGASVAGDWAPLFTLGTGRPALYLAEPDNSPERLGELRPDAFLYSDTRDGRRARELLVAGVDGLRLGPALYTDRYVGRDVILYEVIGER